MKTRLALLLHVPALAATLAAAGCGDRARDDDTLRIGAIVEMTGEMPAVGASSRNAAELAVDVLNAAGGITVAECMLRSGAELSARVRLDKPELVEEAAQLLAALIWLRM